jgi:hypothetical protein
VLERAWVEVRRNGGASGIDRTTIADVEEYGVARLLDELAVDLQAERYRPLPARRVWIPKPGSSERRPLSIPSVRDRVVQAAVKLVIEPVFEADFLPCSFGFRPKRGAHDALQVLIDETWRGRRWIVETDIASCFEAIPHDKLMHAVEERVVDRRVLKLLRAMLRAGVMEDGTVTRTATGTPQGGVVTPQTQPITGGSKGLIGHRDRVADDDALGTDEDLFDHAAQHFLAGFDSGGVGRVAQLGEEAVQTLGQLEVAVAVEELRLERRQGCLQAGLFGPQLGHC